MADKVHTAPATAATASTRVKAGCSGPPLPADASRSRPRALRFLGRMPTANTRPPTTVARDTLWTALLMGRPQRTRAPGSATLRAAAAPEKISAAARPRKSAARPASCQGTGIPRLPASRTAAPLPGLECGGVERGFAAEDT